MVLLQIGNLFQNTGIVEHAVQKLEAILPVLIDDTERASCAIGEGFKTRCDLVHSRYETTNLMWDNAQNGFHFNQITSIQSV